MLHHGVGNPQTFQASLSPIQIDDYALEEYKAPPQKTSCQEAEMEC